MSLIEAIEADEIRRLTRQYRDATLEYEKDKLRVELDRIANARLDGARVVGESGADCDEAVESLRGFGAFTVAEWFSTNGLRKIQEEPRHIRGMLMLGLPYEETERIATSLQQGRMPAAVIATVVVQQTQIESLHPDKYPFSSAADEVISSGLTGERIPVGRVWRSAKRALVRRGRPDLALRYGYDGPTPAITSLLVHYALTTYDIGELNRTRQELHF